jgi:hypothetical protein
VAEVLPPVVDTATDLLRSMRETGTVEGLQSFAFYGATSTSRFDEVSHVLPSYNLVSNCQQYATEPSPACDAHFGPGRAAAQEHAARSDRERPQRDGRERPVTQLLDYLLGR